MVTMALLSSSMLEESVGVVTMEEEDEVAAGVDESEFPALIKEFLMSASSLGDSCTLDVTGLGPLFSSNWMLIDAGSLVVLNSDVDT